jgi:hypothetical protein
VYHCSLACTSLTRSCTCEKPVIGEVTATS